MKGLGLDTVNHREKTIHDHIKDSFELLVKNFDESPYQVLGFYYFFYNICSIKNINEPVFQRFYSSFFDKYYDYLSLTQKVEALFQFVLSNTNFSTYGKFLQRLTEEFKTLLSERKFTLITTLPRQFERSEGSDGPTSQRGGDGIFFFGNRAESIPKKFHRFSLDNKQKIRLRSPKFY